MATLPKGILTRILECLKLSDRQAASQTCKLWRDACNHPSMRDCEVVEITNNKQLRSIMEVSVNGPRFPHFRFSNFEIAGDTTAFWERFGPYMKSLVMLNSNLNEVTFKAILLYCSNLESLSLRSFPDVFHSGVSFLPFQSLVHLNLNGNYTLTNSTFLHLARLCPMIIKLDLSNTEMVVEKTIDTVPLMVDLQFLSIHYQDLQQRRMQHVGSGNDRDKRNRLRELWKQTGRNSSLNFLSFSTVVKFIKEEASSVDDLCFSHTLIKSDEVSSLALIPGLKLRSLVLYDCMMLSDRGVVALSEHQTSLTVLDLGMCDFLKDTSLIAICAGLVNLQVLSVEHTPVTDKSIAHLKNLAELRSLNISGCRCVQGDGIIEGLCQRVNPTLRELRMRFLDAVPDEVVVQLARSLPRLTLLDLGLCYNAVTDRSLVAILYNNPELSHLDLTECRNLTDRVLHRVGWSKAVKTIPICPASCSGLIRMMRNKRLRGRIVVRFNVKPAQSCKLVTSLRYLSLFGPTQVGSITFRHFYNMTTLDLCYSGLITRAELKLLVKNNENLEALKLGVCNIWDGDVTFILKNLRRLRDFAFGSRWVTDWGAHAITKHGGGLQRLVLLRCRVTWSGASQIMRRLTNLQQLYFKEKLYRRTSSTESNCLIPVNWCLHVKED